MECAAKGGDSNLKLRCKVTKVLKKYNPPRSGEKNVEKFAEYAAKVDDFLFGNAKKP